MPDAPAVPTCRVCGCTDEHACAGGCAWFAPGLCTVCALTVEALYEWVSRGVNPDFRALSTELDAYIQAENAKPLRGDDEPLIVVVPG